MLASTQEIVKTDFEAYGTSVVNIETKHRSTVKLVFQRDKDMPNYLRITELERKYYRLIDEESSFANKNQPSSYVENWQISKWWNALPILIGLISIGFVGNYFISVGIAAGGSIIVYAINSVFKSKEEKRIKKELEETWKKCGKKKENTRKEQNDIFEQLKN